MKREYSFLESENHKINLKNINNKEAEKLAEEIREFLVESVETTGGHLASNLGVVELTLALHKVFDTPSDRIIWDVGHQSYVHKILTGRAKDFDTLRTPGGLSGFTKRSESEHDAYGTGHSSTSISAAIGFAEADRLQNKTSYTVAVLGDGAFTGGLVHEALNNIDKNLRLIIILNENEMSISKNIGAFSRHIAKMRATRGYLKTKSFTRTVVTRIPLIGKGLFRGIRRVKKGIKNAMYGSNYFEDLGLYYLGPADGNNFEAVENLLQEAIASGQSTVIHLKTTKGKGYTPAEEKPNEYHSVAPQGCVAKTNVSTAMGETLTTLAAEDDKIVAITAAMADGCGITSFAENYPTRFFDVGIAEEHALIFAAGLSLGGMKPVVPIYSSFLQRGYDSILHDIALQQVPVVVPIDRA
ncbi:MAG: 1-deoxy-D-xylulose-5-phosphate synthase, partial [Clostridia bacterium]|nr:1-deoxy-D-xylulose-5-phosphate synthase [Clostridia bacterium]